ncbi:MAG: DUF362 domain-containing protein [DPANN group archaeon]|nr:DUF362 domain-containing protein [DPANN group archaeon]
MTNIYVTKCDNYSEKQVDKAVAYCMKSFMKTVKTGSSILLKPNLLAPRNVEDAVTTNPAIIASVARILKVKKCKVYLGDSQGFGTYENVLKLTGIGDVCKSEGIKIIEFKDAKEVETAVGPLSIFNGLKDYDYIINLPKAKTHALTGFTGAQKNLFGVVCGFRKSKYHLKFPDPRAFSMMVVHLSKLANPSFNLMDCVIGMEGDGPNAGTPKELGFIAASESAPGLDLFVTNLLGFKPKEVSTLVVESSENDFDIDFSNLKIISDVDIDKLRPKHFKKANTNKFGHLLKLAGRYLSPYPFITEKCTNCNTCVINCPAEAISKGVKFPKINYSKCIHCYCCSEACPKKAITVKKRFLGKLFDV